MPQNLEKYSTQVGLAAVAGEEVSNIESVTNDSRDFIS